MKLTFFYYSKQTSLNTVEKTNKQLEEENEALKKSHRFIDQKFGELTQKYKALHDEHIELISSTKLELSELKVEQLEELSNMEIAHREQIEEKDKKILSLSIELATAKGEIKGAHSSQADFKGISEQLLQTLKEVAKK